ncbi:hypothetical protein Tco_1385267 [Tanacetum coccineum]
MLLIYESNTAYGLDPIRRIPVESALVVEIDLTWSLGFISVEMGRLPNPLSSASVEAQISLIMFEFSSCLFADSAMNLVSDSSIVFLRSGYEEFPLFRCCRSWYGTFRIKDLSSWNIQSVIKQDYLLHISKIVLRTFHQEFFKSLLSSEKDFVRVSQFVIEPDGSFLSQRLAAPIKDMGKAQSII